jgi:hypothetical protein
VNLESVREELAAIAFANLGDYVAWNGEAIVVRPSHELTRRQLSAVRQVSIRDGWVTVTLYDRLKALDALCKHLGMYVTKVEMPQLANTLEALEEKLAGFSDLELRNRMRALEASLAELDKKA